MNRRRAVAVDPSGGNYGDVYTVVGITNQLWGEC